MADSKYHTEMRERLKSARVGAGAYIREVRENHRPKLSQRELAEKLNLPLYSFVSMVETGATYVRPEALAAWAEALGVDPQEFERKLLWPEVFH
jgi:transcriptional regulator with XRE-family HTH domain